MFRFVDRIRPFIPSFFRSTKVNPSEEQKLFRLNKKPNVAEGETGSKRRPMTEAVVVNPWYTVMRKRNMMIIMIGLPLFMFSGFIEDIFKAARRGQRFEEEKRKFLKQLDEEDRLYEMKIMEARKKLKNQDK